MFVFIDTNVFYNNWFASNADFKFLFNFIENTHGTLLMSELVCQEVENIRRREIDAIIENLTTEAKKARKLMKAPPAFEFNKLKDSFDFRQILKDKVARVTFIPYESIKQSVLVKRALLRIRPFQEEDKGFRDTLIWLSLLEYLKGNKIREDVIFIINNKSDFYSGNKNEFHKELQADIDAASLKCKILPYDSLFQFVSNEALRAEHEFTYHELYEKYLNDIEYEIEDNTIRSVNGLSNSEMRDQLKGSNKSFPGLTNLIDFSFTMDEGIEDEEVIAYKRIAADTFYVNFIFNLRRCTLAFTIPTPDYYTGQELIDSNYYNIEAGKDETILYSYLRPDFSVSFNFYIGSDTIEDFNLNYVNFI